MTLVDSRISDWISDLCSSYLTFLELQCGRQRRSYQSLHALRAAQCPDPTGGRANRTAYHPTSFPGGRMTQIMRGARAWPLFSPQECLLNILCALSYTLCRRTIRLWPRETLQRKTRKSVVKGKSVSVRVDLGGR